MSGTFRDLSKFWYLVLFSAWSTLGFVDFDSFEFTFWVICYFGFRFSCWVNVRCNLFIWCFGETSCLRLVFGFWWILGFVLICRLLKFANLGLRLGFCVLGFWVCVSVLDLCKLGFVSLEF